MNALIYWLSTTIGTAAILTALVAAFWHVIMNRITASVKSQYDKELESHIDSLRHKTELALKEFEAKANERNIKLSETFDTQAKVIVNIYQKLTALYYERNSGILFRPLSPERLSDFLTNVVKQRQEFWSYYRLNKIYVPRRTAIIIEAFETKMTCIHHELEINSSDYPKAPNVINNKIELHKIWNTKIPEMLAALEDELQSLLGFPVSDAQAVK